MSDPIPISHPQIPFPDLTPDPIPRSHPRSDSKIPFPTYGFSFNTLQTDAIVLKQSVVLSNVSVGFCAHTKHMVTGLVQGQSHDFTWGNHMTLLDHNQ